MKTQIYRQLPAHIAVIYHGSPERFLIVITGRPKTLLKRKQKHSKMKLGLGYAYRFNDVEDADNIASAAKALLSERDGAPDGFWFAGPVSRACWAIDRVIEEERQRRQDLKDNGNVVGSLKYRAVHSLLGA